MGVDGAALPVTGDGRGGGLIDEVVFFVAHLFHEPTHQTLLQSGARGVIVKTQGIQKTFHRVGKAFKI
jgi:hypothetical protein